METKKEEKFVDVEVDLDAEVVEALQKMADERGITLNEIMIEAIREQIEKVESKK